MFRSLSTLLSLAAPLLIISSILAACSDELPPAAPGTGGNQLPVPATVVFTEINNMTDWESGAEMISVRSDGTARTDLRANGIIVSTPRKGKVPSVLMSTHEVQIADLTVENGPARVLVDSSQDLDPFSVAVSPDGTRVVYATVDHDDQQYHLYICRLDGSGKVELSALFAKETTPSFSPDGGRVAFYGRTSSTEIGRVYTVNIDGSNLSIVSDRVGVSADGYMWLDWSPAGDRIVFGDKTNDSIYIATADGRQTTELAAGAWGVWSPDGSTIAFTALDGDIWGIAPDGTNLRNLSDSPGQLDLFAQWSPDGRKILFTAYGGAVDQTPGTLKVLDIGSKAVTVLSGKSYKGFWAK